MAEPIPPKAPREKRQIKTQAVPGMQTFLPSMPVNGNDLIGQWNLPNEAITGAALKIARPVPMDAKKYQVLRVVTVRDYQLSSIARDFGPGDYILTLSPGPGGAWGSKHASINVSEDYAAECGFMALMPEPVMPPPPPRFSDMRVMRETAQTLNTGGTFTPEMFFSALEVFGEKLATRLAPPPAPVQQFDPMMIIKMLDDSRNSGIQLARDLMQGNLPGKDEDEDTGWPGVIREIAPHIAPALAGLATAFMGNRQPVQTQPAAPVEVNPAMVQQEQKKMEIPLTADEQRELAPAVALLQPYASRIVGMLAGVTSGFEISEGLAGYIGPDMEATMIKFAEIAEQRGPSVLALIHPGLASQKGHECLIGIGKILKGGEE